MDGLNSGLIYAAIGAFLARIPGLVQMFLARRQTPVERVSSAIVHEASSIDILKEITAELRTELERKIQTNKHEHDHALDLEGRLHTEKGERRASDDVVTRLSLRILKLESLLRENGIAYPLL